MFSFFSPQAIHFGRGQAEQAPMMARAFGETVLLVHGAGAARAQWLMQSCKDADLTLRTLSCGTEPSVPDIETARAQLDGFRPDVVIALGGGSVIDFAKALAALIPCNGVALDYLEGVGGGKALDHAPIAMIAIPTTAGTGAEVTKNAVITVPDHGVKVSLRDARMIPDIAIIDPSLMQGAPRRIALSAGLDAVTQVIEPYLSVKANPMTDAICVAAIPRGLKALRGIVEHDASAAWDDMAWVSTSGGLALANAGLGAVHGFAGVIGGKTLAPHGEVCGALLTCVLQSHVAKAQAGTEIHEKLQWVLALIDVHFGQAQAGTGLHALRDWSKGHGLRGLAEMGVADADHADIARASAGASSMKGNPFTLAHDDLISILAAAQ